MFYHSLSISYGGIGNYWTEEDLGYVRRSEKMSDAIRNPNDRKAPKERLFSLEGRIGDMYEAMKTAGTQHFGSEFHFGMTKFRELRPFSKKTCGSFHHTVATQRCSAPPQRCAPLTPCSTCDGHSCCH